MAESESFVLRTLKNSISGTAGGIAVCLVGHPFDTLKVRLQTQSIQNPIYKGLVDCFVKTLKWEGVGGLYKGVGSPIVGQMFFRATLFTSYYQISTWMADPAGTTGRLQNYQYFLCGACTGTIVAFVEGPIDLFKTKMQIQIMRARRGEQMQYRNVFDAGFRIVKQFGAKGAFQGLGATVIRNTPANAAYFGFFELTRDLLTAEGATVKDLSFSQVFLAGGVAGFMYWVTTYPADVVKSAMMSDDSAKSNRRFRNVGDCAVQLFRNEGGFKRFYRGFTPCLLRSVPANATMLLTVEMCRKYLPL